MTCHGLIRSAVGKGEQPLIGERVFGTLKPNRLT
jgi:hypothetical protein